MIVEEFLQTYANLLLHGSWLVVGIAVVAGLLSSAICPFTLPVGLGVAGVAGTAESRARGSGFLIATAFFGGLVLTLTALGALAGILGLVVTQAVGHWWMLIMSALAFLAALAVLSGPSLRLPAMPALRGFLAPSFMDSSLVSARRPSPCSLCSPSPPPSTGRRMAPCWPWGMA